MAQNRVFLLKHRANIKGIEINIGKIKGFFKGITMYSKNIFIALRLVSIYYKLYNTTNKIQWHSQSPS
jgi:hypothetical protein